MGGVVVSTSDEKKAPPFMERLQKEPSSSFKCINMATNTKHAEIQKSKQFFFFRKCDKPLKTRSF